MPDLYASGALVWDQEQGRTATLIDKELAPNIKATFFGRRHYKGIWTEHFHLCQFSWACMPSFSIPGVPHLFSQGSRKRSTRSTPLSVFSLRVRSTFTLHFESPRARLGLGLLNLGLAHQDFLASARSLRPLAGSTTQLSALVA